MNTKPDLSIFREPPHESVMAAIRELGDTLRERPVVCLHIGPKPKSRWVWIRNGRSHMMSKEVFRHLIEMGGFIKVHTPENQPIATTGRNAGWHCVEVQFSPRRFSRK